MKQTLEEAQKQLWQGVEKGIQCPCCEQFAKVYQRKINSSMARAFLLLAKAYPEGQWVHVVNFLTERNIVSRDVVMLRHWGFLQKSNYVKQDGNPSSGFYRVTELGYKFAKCQYRAVGKVVLYNDKVRGFTGKEVTVRQCLGKKFNYSELFEDQNQLQMFA